jgi:hypothetical protein
MQQLQIVQSDMGVAGDRGRSRGGGGRGAEYESVSRSGWSLPPLFIVLI